MRLKNLDLLLVLSFVALNVLITLLPYKFPVVEIIVTLPLVFVLPGYVLSEAIFHKRTFDAAQRLTSSLALSLAIVIISGFILNVLPIGLHTISWSLFLSSLTTLFSFWVAILRRRTLMHEKRFPKFHFPLYGYVLFGLAVIVAIFSIQYSAIGVVQQPHPGFTQLWILPSKQTNNSCAVSIGVHSFETTPITYRIVMTINGNQVNAWSSIVLAPQEVWDQSVSIKPGLISSIYIEARLYNVKQPETVYRNVHLTFHSLKVSTLGQGQQCSLLTQ